MRSNDVLGFIFAGTLDDKIPELAASRTTASIPIGGKYRVIDFVLSNMSNAGINNVGIIAKSNFLSLTDHVGSGSAYDLSKRISNLEKGRKMPPFRDILPGDTIDLGGRTLEVYGLPGHTPGGILLLLKEDRILFTGDSINHHLWMQLDGCLPMHEFVKELDRIMFLQDRADIILHGHAQSEDDISLLRCLRAGAEEICEGKTDRDLPYRWFGGTGLQHPFRCEPGRRYSQEDHVICYRPANI